MRRIVATLLLVMTLATPASALAQSFGPLPAPQPAPQTETQPPKSRDFEDDDDISSTTTIVLFASVLAVIGAIVLYIRRDARNAAPVDRRGRSKDGKTKTPGSEGLHGGSAQRHKQERKQQARRKAKQQRAARKKQR